jgi:hypothetical protein
MPCGLEHPMTGKLRIWKKFLRRCAIAALQAMLLSPALAHAVDNDAVDLALVLAVDQSSSVESRSIQLQRDGHVDALRSAEVARAIASGQIGCIAITYVEWSSVGRLDIVLPWKKLCSAKDASNAADLILADGSDGFQRRGRGRTSLSFAIDASRLLLERYPGYAGRKVIDISTNGTNNDGQPVRESRARASELGYTVNGIALSRDEPGVTNDLPGYLEENVITGVGAFVAAPRKPRDYVMVLRRKLVLEISNGSSGAAGVQHAANFGNPPRRRNGP